MRIEVTSLSDAVFVIEREMEAIEINQKKCKIGSARHCQLTDRWIDLDQVRTLLNVRMALEE